MTDLLPAAVISVLVAIPVTAALLIGREEWRSVTPALQRQTWISLATVPPNVAIYLLLAPFWAAVYLFAQNVASMRIEFGLLSALAVVLACDLSYYIEHTCGHRIGFIWRLYHGTHHTGADYHVPLAYRVNGLNHLLAPVFYLPWVCIGFDPLMVLGGQLFVFHYQAWLHTERIGRLGWLDKWFNTPATHRVHHSRALAHQHVNLGGLTMVWDRLFGTYHVPVDDLHYGLANCDDAKTFSGVYINPWRKS